MPARRGARSCMDCWSTPCAIAGATREDLRRLAMWLTVEEPQLRAVIDEALDTVQAVASGAFWAEAKESPECHEEAPFAVLEKRDGLSTVLNGVIDLVHRSPGGWKIVDYKTDRDAEAADLVREVRRPDCRLRARMEAVRARERRVGAYFRQGRRHQPGQLSCHHLVPRESCPALGASRIARMMTMYLPVGTRPGARCHRPHRIC